MTTQEAISILSDPTFLLMNGDKTKAIDYLSQKVKELEENSRKVYFADGTSILFKTSEEVIAFRIETAKLLSNIMAQLENRKITR